MNKYISFLIVPIMLFGASCNSGYTSHDVNELSNAYTSTISSLKDAKASFDQFLSELNYYTQVWEDPDYLQCIALLKDKVSVSEIRKIADKYNVNLDFTQDGESITIREFFNNIISAGNDLLQQKTWVSDQFRKAADLVTLMIDVMVNVFHWTDEVIDDLNNEIGFRRIINKLTNCY